MKIPVIFRRYYAGPLIALFPTEPADYSGRYVMSYQSIGQHGAADYEHVMKVSTAATPWEYSEIKAELEAMGYKLRVVKRASKKQHEKRMAKARKIWAIMAPTIPFAKRNPGASSLITMGLASGIASGVAFGVTNHILAKRRMNNPLDAGELDSLLTHSEEMMLLAIDAEKNGDLITAHALASVAVSAASISGIYGDKSAFKKDTLLKMDAEVFLQNATEMRGRIERKLKVKTMPNPRTTKAELNELVEHLKRITGLNYHIGYAYGRPRLYLEEPATGGRMEVSPRLPKGQLKEWMYAYIKGMSHRKQIPSFKKDYPAQNPAAQYNPLTQAQIGKLIKSREKGRAKNSATRILINGQNFNIETGQALPRGTNVMYHMVYWDLTRETANMMKDFVQKQNPGQRVTMDYQAGSAKNPQRGGLLKKRLMSFLQGQYGGYVEDWQDDAEVAIYWFANDYHGGQWSDLYAILSTSPYRPGPISTLESEDEVVKMMYQSLVDEFGQAAKNPPLGRTTKKSIKLWLSRVDKNCYWLQVIKPGKVYKLTLYPDQISCPGLWDRTIWHLAKHYHVTDLGHNIYEIRPWDERHPVGLHSKHRPLPEKKPTLVTIAGVKDAEAQGPFLVNMYDSQGNFVGYKTYDKFTEAQEAAKKASEKYHSSSIKNRAGTTMEEYALGRLQHRYWDIPTAENPEKPGVVWPVGAKLYDGRGKPVGVCLDTPNAIAKAMMEHPEIEAAHTILGVKSRADYASRMQSWNTAKSHFKPMVKNPGMKFKELDVGSVFVFASEKEWYSRGMAKGPWVKVSERMYSPEDDKSVKHRVGTVNVEVIPYHQARKGYRAPKELPPVGRVIKFYEGGTLWTGRVVEQEPELDAVRVVPDTDKKALWLISRVMIVSSYSKNPGQKPSPADIQEALDLLEEGNLPMAFELIMGYGISQAEAMKILREAVKQRPHLKDMYAHYLKNPRKPMTADEAIEAWNANKVKLDAVAEALQRDSGKKVPRKGTKAYKKMYEKWVNYLFRDFPQNVGNLAREFARNENGPTAGKKRSKRNNNGLSPGGCVIGRE